MEYFEHITLNKGGRWYFTSYMIT